MNCPGCGAAMEPVGNRNHLRCPHCRRFHFPEEPDDGVLLTGAASPYACPVCPKQALAAALIEGRATHACPQCRGFFMALSDFGYVVECRRGRPPMTAPAPPRPFDPRELNRTIVCPACRKRMETYPYAGGGSAVVDACNRCQFIWIDAGELAVISAYIPVRRPMPAAPPIVSSTSEPTTLWDRLLLGD